MVRNVPLPVPLKKSVAWSNQTRQSVALSSQSSEIQHHSVGPLHWWDGCCTGGTAAGAAQSRLSNTTLYVPDLDTAMFTVPCLQTLPVSACAVLHLDFIMVIFCHSQPNNQTVITVCWVISVCHIQSQSYQTVLYQNQPFDFRLLFNFSPLQDVQPVILWLLTRFGCALSVSSLKYENLRSDKMFKLENWLHF